MSVVLERDLPLQTLPVGLNHALGSSQQGSWLTYCWGWGGKEGRCLAAGLAQQVASEGAQKGSSE